MLTLNGSQNRRLGPRLFCLPRCSSESCASSHYQRHLQEWNQRRGYPGVLVLGTGANFLCVWVRQPSDPREHVDLRVPPSPTPTPVHIRGATHPGCYPTQKFGTGHFVLGLHWEVGGLGTCFYFWELTTDWCSSGLSPTMSPEKEVRMGASFHRVESSRSARQGQAGSFPSSICPICTCPLIGPDQTWSSCLPTACPAPLSRTLPRGQVGKCPAVYKGPQTAGRWGTFSVTSRQSRGPHGPSNSKDFLTGSDCGSQQLPPGHSGRREPGKVLSDLMHSLLQLQLRPPQKPQGTAGVSLHPPPTPWSLPLPHSPQGPLLHLGGRNCTVPSTPWPSVLGSGPCRTCLDSG